MGGRPFNLLLAALLAVLGVIALQPYIERQFYAATTPRPIEARGNLADYERAQLNELLVETDTSMAAMKCPASVLG